MMITREIFKRILINSKYFCKFILNSIKIDPINNLIGKFWEWILKSRNKKNSPKQYANGVIKIGYRYICLLYK
jgi:hypothetical protein